MNDGPMYDVRPEQYATDIRELIRHENDVTNHRIMWLLIVQGLLANAFVVSRTEHAARGIALAGIFVTMSAFVMLYKSYQARGYLHFLGEEAKLGRLREDYLPLDGWPKKRIKNWRSSIWFCPWLQQASDLLAPYLFLPTLIVSAWVFLVLLPLIRLTPVLVLGLAIVLTVIVLSVFCIAWVWSQRGDEEESVQGTVREPTLLRAKDSR